MSILGLREIKVDREQEAQAGLHEPLAGVAGPWEAEIWRRAWRPSGAVADTSRAHFFLEVGEGTWG